MKKILISLLRIIIGCYLVLCVALYFFQENLIFHPQKLHQDYQFNFPQNFEELNFEASDGKLLNGLLFKADNARGLIFYLHGNAGSLSSWGYVADVYLKLNYDVFVVDYRGFGKSEGSITSEEQLFEDNQLIYDEFKQRYQEDNIVILGYSIGTGLAAKLACKNRPKQLILQAPYYSLTALARQMFPLVPTFILKYRLATNEFLNKCNMPVTIFHGNNDLVINYGSSLKLKEEFSNKVELIVLDGQGHNGMTDNSDYKRKLIGILQ